MAMTFKGYAIKIWAHGEGLACYESRAMAEMASRCYGAAAPTVYRVTAKLTRARREVDRDRRATNPRACKESSMLAWGLHLLAKKTTKRKGATKR